MSENLIFSANTKKIYKRFYLTYLFLGIFFLFYEIINLKVDSKHINNYTIIIVLILKFLWDLFTYRFVEKLQFDDAKNKLIVTEKNYFGKNKIYSINYPELNYEIENSNNFWKIFVGKKILTMLKNKLELFKIGVSAGFNYQQISETESKLNEIKNAYR